MNWISQHSDSIAMGLDLALMCAVVLGARYSPRAKRALCEAIAEQVGQEVARQIRPLREDIAALRSDLHPVTAEVVDVTTDRIELVIVQHDDAAERN